MASSTLTKRWILTKLHLPSLRKRLTYPRRVKLSNIPYGWSPLAAQRGECLTQSKIRPAKFPNVQNLTLFFPSNHGEDTTRISFIGFKGEYSPLTVRLSAQLLRNISLTDFSCFLQRDPVITVYEAQVCTAEAFNRDDMY
jgi:hypothetical protein